MGLSWQQGPLSPGAAGRFLVPGELPPGLLYAEPLRRRLRVRFGGVWIADGEDVALLFEPGRYPTAYFRAIDVLPGVLTPASHTTRHPDLGPTIWFSPRAGNRTAARDGGFAPGLDPARRDFASFAGFADPDGNTWLLQERGYRAE